MRCFISVMVLLFTGSFALADHPEFQAAKEKALAYEKDLVAAAIEVAKAEQKGKAAEKEALAKGAETTKKFKELLSQLSEAAKTLTAEEAAAVLKDNTAPYDAAKKEWDKAGPALAGRGKPEVRKLHVQKYVKYNVYKTVQDSLPKQKK